MYYYVDTDGLVRLLDGDKIATLCAMFVMDLVKAAGVEIKVGVVQTAYANGNSTSYLSKVLVPPLLESRELTGRKSQFLVRRRESSTSITRLNGTIAESTLKPTATAQSSFPHMPSPSSTLTTPDLLRKTTP